MTKASGKSPGRLPGPLGASVVVPVVVMPVVISLPPTVVVLALVLLGRRSGVGGFVIIRRLCPHLPLERGRRKAGKEGGRRNGDGGRKSIFTGGGTRLEEKIIIWYSIWDSPASKEV